MSADTSAANVVGGGSLGINPLLAVQEVTDAMSGGAQAKARGEALLDRLEDLRLGMLMGFMPRDKLEELARLVRDRGKSVKDRRLAEILGEIELRAEVELAKLSIDV